MAARTHETPPSIGGSHTSVQHLPHLEHLQRDGLVLQLAALAGALDGDVRGDVADAHRRLHLQTQEPRGPPSDMKTMLDGREKNLLNQSA